MQNTSDRLTERQSDRQTSITGTSEGHTSVMAMKMTERGTLTDRQKTVHWVEFE